MQAAIPPHPEAKFVHIHRDPYRVFQSSRRTLSILLDWHRLQRPDGIDMDEWVLRSYRAMYDAFFEDRPLIPSANYYEIAFEELEQNPYQNNPSYKPRTSGCLTGADADVTPLRCKKFPSLSGSGVKPQVS